MIQKFKQLIGYGPVWGKSSDTTIGWCIGRRAAGHSIQLGRIDGHWHFALPRVSR